MELLTCFRKRKRDDNSQKLPGQASSALLGKMLEIHSKTSKLLDLKLGIENWELGKKTCRIVTNSKIKFKQ